MDGLKEIYDSMTSRLKSHVFGSIVIAFVLWNWKVIYVLFSSDMTILDRIEFFDCNTSPWSLYVFPALTGVIWGLLAPPINAGAHWAVARPLNYMKSNDLKYSVKREFAEARYRSEEVIDLSENKAKAAKFEADAAVQVARQEQAESQFQNLLKEKESLAAELEAARRSEKNQLENMQYNQVSAEVTLMNVMAAPQEAAYVMTPEVSRVADFFSKRESYQAPISELRKWYEQVNANGPDIYTQNDHGNYVTNLMLKLDRILSEHSGLKLFQQISNDRGTENRDPIFRLTPLGLYLLKHRPSRD